MIMFYDLIALLFSKEIEVIAGVISALASLIGGLAYILKIIYNNIFKRLIRKMLFSICRDNQNISSDEDYLLIEVLNKVIQSLSKKIKKLKKIKSFIVIKVRLIILKILLKVEDMKT